MGMQLAQQSNTEIISADAFQIYKYMDIGTATPNHSELKTIPHHLINTLDPTEPYSAGAFVSRCENLISEIQKRGNTPLIVGGTAMYINSLVNGMFQEPEKVTQTKADFYEQHKHTPVDNLYKQLKIVDKTYAEKITHGDRQKIIRALHIFQTTGETFTHAQKIFHTQPQFTYNVFVVPNQRELLYQKINNRVALMFENGWVDEVQNLINMGYEPSNSRGFQAIGYTEIFNYLQPENTAKLQDIIDNIATKTRRFAKRQLTWFRNSNLYQTPNYPPRR